MVKSTDEKITKSASKTKVTTKSKMDGLLTINGIPTSTSRKPMHLISRNASSKSSKNNHEKPLVKSTLKIPVASSTTKKTKAVIDTTSSNASDAITKNGQKRSIKPSSVPLNVSKSKKAAAATTTTTTSVSNSKVIIIKSTAKSSTQTTNSTSKSSSSLSTSSKSSESKTLKRISIKPTVLNHVSKKGKTTASKVIPTIISTAAAINEHALLLAKLRKNKTKQDLTSLVTTIKKEEIKKAKQAIIQQQQLEKKLLLQEKKKLKSSLKSKSNSKISKRNKNLKRKRCHSSSSTPVVKREKRIKKIWEERDWEGYSDDEGSVDSGVLDENICFECGITTHRKIEWESLILCDMCDAEYHMKCVGLDLHPRHQFTCPRCLTESKHFQKLDFSIDTVRFPTPVVKKVKRGDAPVELPGICYSPSRPLELAWPECVDKGFMVVSRLFSYDVMRMLTHGTLERVTLSGRVAETWPGATTLFAQKAQALTATNVINRGGRYDVKIPEFVIEALQLEQILQPVVDKLRSIMGTPTPRLRTHNIIFVPVGTEPQAWHCDDTITRSKNSLYRYFTILIHLNPIDAMCGGTELWVKSLKRGDMVRGRPGDAFVFDGSLLHRGQANLGHVHRLFYYASFACRNDTNNDEK